VDSADRHAFNPRQPEIVTRSGAQRRVVDGGIAEGCQTGDPYSTLQQLFRSPCDKGIVIYRAAIYRPLTSRR
jgi:hypothetical protein